MIKGIFIINSNGKARLLRLYDEKRVSPSGPVPPLCSASRVSAQHFLWLPFDVLQTEEQQQALVREIFSLLSKRTDAVCNFLEGGR